MPNFTVRCLEIEQLRPGMELAQIVVTEGGRFALAKGTVLTEKMVQGLRNWGVAEVHVRLPKEEASPSLSMGEERFYAAYTAIVSRVNQLFERVRAENFIPIDEAHTLVRDQIEPLLQQAGIVEYLHFMRRWDDYTFYHAVNVSILSGLMGRWTGCNDAQIRSLLLAGLLHDVGKIYIPLEILNKPGKLTQEEMNVMQRHAAYGYQLVRKLKELPPEVMQGVLQHHERMDASGYPHHLPGSMIEPSARIIAVADTYDAMTSERAYRHKLNPFTVVETLAHEMYEKLDIKVCTAFLQNIRNCFLGNVVLLSDGQLAEVVYLSNILAARPVVRTLNNRFIDLEFNKEINIVGFCPKGACLPATDGERESHGH